MTTGQMSCYRTGQITNSQHYFDSVLQQVIANDTVDAAAVHNRFGDIIYRQPDPDKYIGKNIAGGDAFKLYLRSNQRLTRYLGVAVTDNIKRILVFSKVGDTDLDIGVSARFDVAMATWRSNSLVKALIFVILAGLSLALAWGTQRHLLERRRNDAAMLAAQKIGRTGSWVYTIATDKVWGSAEAYRLFGYPPEIGDFSLDDIESCIPERERVHQALVALISEGREYDLEYVINPADGSPSRAIYSVAKLERDEQGKLLRVLGFIQDITERKQAEDALRKSEEKYRTLIQKIQTAVVVHGPDTRILTCNPVAQALLGLTEDQLLGKAAIDPDWHFFRDDGTVLGLEEYPVSQVLAKREAVRNFVVGVHRPGREQKNDVWVLVNADPVFVNETEIVQVIVTCTDITERKQAEVEHAQIEGRLRESQKMEALGTLAGGVAHDFNNALAMILGNVELARQDVGPGHAALVSLEEIGKASRRAKDLVQQILAFGRRQKLERKVMSLALVVVETARLMRATLPAMVSLSVDCKGDTPAVLADATAVKQILLNLCSNASQAVQDQAQPGVIEFRLEAHTQGEERGNLRSGRYACLTVRDNGPGMDEATRSHIFEPFFSTKPVGKGTGLGLSVVHGMVQAHEASIEVESAPGEGSAFRIYFPAVDAPAADVIAPVPDTAPVQGKGKHVLYLDDEEAIIFLMKRLLERKGYRVSGYTEPRKALEAVRANPGEFDLAVTDYYMPGMSGLEVAQALKEIRPDLPVVMASGYISEELRAKAPAVGIRELIYKPNTVEDLCEAVARFANAQSANKSSSSSN